MYRIFNVFPGGNFRQGHPGGEVYEEEVAKAFMQFSRNRDEPKKFDLTFQRTLPKGRYVVTFIHGSIVRGIANGGIHVVDKFRDVVWF